MVEKEACAPQFGIHFTKPGDRIVRCQTAIGQLRHEVVRRTDGGIVGMVIAARYGKNVLVPQPRDSLPLYAWAVAEDETPLPLVPVTQFNISRRQFQRAPQAICFLFLSELSRSS